MSDRDPPSPVPPPPPVAPPTLSLNAIGVFRSLARYPYDVPRQGVADQSKHIGEIELFSGQGYEQALDDLAGFERIWVLYHFHQNPNWKPKVVPPRGPRVKRGVFATRSPYRPNPLGLSCVELVSVKGLRLFVRGTDLIDGTPVLDIKPYLPYADAFPESRIGWLEDVEKSAYRVELTDTANEQVSWLQANGVPALRPFLLAQLEYEPTDEKRKRVRRLTAEETRHAAQSAPERPERPEHYVIAYRTWRALYWVDHSQGFVRVERIFSGYSEEDLRQGASDLYQDKTIHRNWKSKFEA